MSSTTIWNVGWRPSKRGVQQRNRGGGREYLLAMERLGFQYAYRAGVVTDRKNFARVHAAGANGTSSTPASNASTVRAQYHHYPVRTLYSVLREPRLNQFNFQFNRRARREFLLVDMLSIWREAFSP